MLAATAQAFRFPDWFGHNWDALADSLADLSWLPAPGYLLIIERYTALASAAPEAWLTFIDILDETQAQLGDDGTPWRWHLVDSATP